MEDSSNGESRGGGPVQNIKRGDLERVDVSDIEMGMFIAELDRPWLETPFLLQGFELRDEDDLENLKKYCQHIYIPRQPEVIKDKPRARTRRGQRLLNTENKGTLLKASSSLTTQPQKHRIVSSNLKSKANIIKQNERLVAVRKEHKIAKKAYSKGKTNINQILSSARFGQMLNTVTAEGIVSGCVDSMLQNPDAMLWMSKMKHEDEYTAEHCLNVCVLAIAFGRHLNFSKGKLQILGLCGLLHDVGKMRTPDEILNKPSSLTDEEFDIMKGHTIEGYQLLVEEGGAPYQAIDVALNHHERPDGKGYPNGLIGKDISAYSRIIAIVDAYDAMTSNRCYSRAVSPVEAQRIIFRNRGSQFDEKYALSFLQAIGPYPPGTVVELHNGMVGIVLSGRRKIRHLPMAILVRNAEKEEIDESAVDLSLTSSGELDRGYLIRCSLKDGAFGIKLEEHTI